jgi:hypothetical protein
VAAGLLHQHPLDQLAACEAVALAAPRHRAQLLERPREFFDEDFLGVAMLAPPLVLRFEPPLGLIEKGRPSRRAPYCPRYSAASIPRPASESSRCNGWLGPFSIRDARTTRLREYRVSGGLTFGTNDGLVCSESKKRRRVVGCFVPDIKALRARFETSSTRALEALVANERMEANVQSRSGVAPGTALAGDDGQTWTRAATSRRSPRRTSPSRWSWRTGWSARRDRSR